MKVGLGKNRDKRPSFGRMSERDSYPIEFYQSPTYFSWFNMKRRCRIVERKETKNHGQRGISYDPSWKRFSGFLNDMGVRPENKTLDRIDVNGNYCKENCRWATLSEQNINRRPGSNTGIKGITKHSKGHYIVKILPFKSKYAPDIGSAKKALELMQKLRRLIKFKEGTMIPESFEIKRRVPREEYGFEEATLSIQFEEGESTEAAIQEAQNIINEALGIEKKEEKKNGKTNSSKNSNKDRKSAPVEDEGTDDESTEDNEAPDAEVRDDDNSESESSESGEDSDGTDSEEAEAEEEPKPAKGKSSKEGKAKEGKKVFQAKPQHYDRRIEQHKEIFSRVLKSIDPDWKKSEASKKKAKKVSEQVEGEPFLDGNGEVVDSFKTRVRKLYK